MVDFVDFALQNLTNLTSGRTARGQANTHGEFHDKLASILFSKK